MISYITDDPKLVQEISERLEKKRLIQQLLRGLSELSIESRDDLKELLDNYPSPQQLHSWSATFLEIIAPDELAEHIIDAEHSKPLQENPQ